MNDKSVPVPEHHPVRENFDPGSLTVGNFVSNERLDEILHEVAGEELLSQEDQSLMPSADGDFMTEEQELEILMQLAAWADTFIFAPLHQTSFPGLTSTQCSRDSDCAHSLERCLNEHNCGEHKSSARAAAQ